MDTVEINVKAGSGGNGAVSFRHEKYVPFGGPDGGDGGSGGNIYLRADRSISNLSQFRSRRFFKALLGNNGAEKKKHGKDGANMEIKVPAGTVVYILEDGQMVFLADLSEHGRSVLAAKGGRGGLGNVHFATSTNQAPRKATKGVVGEEKKLYLDLRLIADVGIIGCPNAGKSTLLAAVSAAKPRIADYKFTTLEPVLGRVETGDKTFILAEIPGLIEGAHLGKGLGYDFLRHAERTKVLLHLLDGSSPTIIEDWGKLNEELFLYRADLMTRPQIIAVNKIDLLEVKGRISDIRTLFKSGVGRVHFISALTGQGVSELMTEVIQVLDKHGEEKKELGEAIKVFRPKPKSRRD